MAANGTSFSPMPQESVVDYVFGAVISALISGELKPGDQLPTEPLLSKKLGVGRNSVREAIKKLEAYGIVEIRRAEGTYICDAYNEKMLDPMLYGLLLTKTDWSDFVKLRSMVEIGVLYLACHEVTPEDIAQTTKIVDEMEAEAMKPVPSVDTLLDIDLAFHSRIAAITHSKMSQDLTEYITKITVPSRRKTIEKILADNEAKGLVNKHRDIVDVLKNQEFGRIEEVVTTHFEYWKTRD